MTLITAQASHWFALQVSDRLLTRDGAEFDPFSNKNIVFEAPDALVSIGYTGDAYLDELPTDQWVVEILTGARLGPAGGRRFAVRVAPIPQWRHIGPALNVLRSELELALRRANARGRHFELLVTGYQWQRSGRARPILLSIVKAADAVQVTVARADRHVGHQFLTGVTPKVNLVATDASRLRTQLRAIRSADDAERILVQAIRDVNTRNALVGRDCMSILISPPSHSHVRVRLVSELMPELALNDRHTVAVRMTARAAFSPWVVGRSVIAAPSIMAGGSTLGIGRYSVTLEAPPATKGLLGAIGAIDRPPRPRR
jgi:hypothetical protein